MKILLATDGSAHSKAALSFLASLPFPPKTEVVVASVFEELGLPRILDRFPGALAGLNETLHDQIRQRLIEEAKELSRPDWTVTTLFREGHPADALVELVDELNAGLVVIGSRGAGGFGAYLLGSVSYRVAAHSPCSVLLVRPPDETEEADSASDSAEEPMRILLALDGSPPAKAALNTLAELDFGNHAAITVMTVLTLVGSYRMDILQKMSDIWLEEKVEAEKELEEAAACLSNFRSVDTRLVEGEDTSEEILKIAEEISAQLIVLGNKGRSAIERFFLGSVSSKVAHHAPCSVLVVKE